MLIFCQLQEINHLLSLSCWLMAIQGRGKYVLWLKLRAEQGQTVKEGEGNGQYRNTEIPRAGNHHSQSQEILLIA